MLCGHIDIYIIKQATFLFSPFCRASFLVSMLPDTQMVSPSLFLKGRAAT